MAFRFVDHERAPTLAYAIGLTLVALVTTAIWGVSITELSSQEKLSAEINVAGRQRMLSQRIVMFATDAVRGDPTKASVRMEQVRGCADLMERAHQALLIRDQEALQATAAEGISCRIGRPVAMAPPNLPPEQRNHFFGGDPSLNDVLRDFLASARSLSTLEKPAQEQALTAMLVSADRLLPERLDALTRALQTEAERANARLMRFKTIMWMATMVLLIIEVLFIFRPMSRVIRKALSERDEKVASLQDRESALSTATEAAELANRQKSRFLGAMNTALRTPLNAIIGYTKLMRQAQTDSVPDKVQTEALLNDIEASAKHLLYTVEEHLSAVRIESGDFNLSEDDIDLDGLIESCLRIVDAEARSARIALRHQPKVFQRHLRADPRLIRHCILTLLQTAIHDSHGGGQVTLSVDDDKPTSGPVAGGEMAGLFGIIVLVTTSGTVPAAPVGRRTDADGAKASAEAQDLQMGLILCRRMMEAHGGSLSIDQGEDYGLRYTLTLPPERVLDL